MESVTTTTAKRYSVRRNVAAMGAGLELIEKLRQLVENVIGPKDLV
jgi:hypothetical protein